MKLTRVCPDCHRAPKIERVVCREKGRSRYMISYDCPAWHARPFPVIYNVPDSMTQDRVILEFNYSEGKFFPQYRDVRLEEE